MSSRVRASLSQAAPPCTEVGVGGWLGPGTGLGCCPHGPYSDVGHGAGEPAACILVLPPEKLWSSVPLMLRLRVGDERASRTPTKVLPAQEGPSSWSLNAHAALAWDTGVAEGWGFRSHPGHAVVLRLGKQGPKAKGDSPQKTGAGKSQAASHSRPTRPSPASLRGRGRGFQSLLGLMVS